jgi:hypothetical protein
MDVFEVAEIRNKLKGFSSVSSRVRRMLGHGIIFGFM